MQEKSALTSVFLEANHFPYERFGFTKYAMQKKFAGKAKNGLCHRQTSGRSRSPEDCIQGN